MSKTKHIIFNGSKNKITINSKFDGTKIIFNIQPLEKMEHILDLDVELHDKEDDIYIHEESGSLQYVLRQIYGYRYFYSIITGYNDIYQKTTIFLKSFEETVNGIDFSVNDFEGFKYLIHLDRLDILDKVLKKLLSLNKKHCYNYVIYI